MTYSPDGGQIATGSDDKTVKLWDAKTGEQLASLQGHTGEVSSVTYSPDGGQIATGSEDKTVKFLDVPGFVGGKETLPPQKGQAAADVSAQELEQEEKKRQELQRLGQEKQRLEKEGLEKERQAKLKAAQEKRV